MSQYVIRNPSLQNSTNRFFAYVIVLLLWFSFLWQFNYTILTLIIETSFMQLLDYLWYSFSVLFFIVLSAMILMGSWAAYNYFRFRYKYRHSKKERVTDIEVYKLLASDSSPVSVIKKSKILVANNNEDKLCIKAADKNDLETLFNTTSK